MNDTSYTFQFALSSFFKEYAKFLNIDLTVSLMDKNNKLHGRNISILIIFQDTLYFLLNTHNVVDTEIENTRKEMISNLRQLLLKYIAANNKNLTQIINYSKIYEVCYNTPYFIQKSTEDIFLKTFKDYYISYRDFYQFIGQINLSEEIKEKFKINGTEHSVLVQAILEFNNMLSHLTNAININDGDKLNNYDKGQNHLFRASLDHYKMLIRLLFLTKKRYNKNTINTFRELRMQEFFLIGQDIQNKKIDFAGNNNKNILECYKEIFNLMIQN